MIELAASEALKVPTRPDLLIVAGVASAVAAVMIVQETHTTSLLLSRWAAFLAGVVILLDIGAAELAVFVARAKLPMHGAAKVAAYIGVAAVAPTILRGFKVTVAGTSVGPFRPYEIVRGALLVRLDDEFGTHMEMKARLIAGKAYGYGIDPEDLAHVMTALVRRKKPTGATKSQIGHILGALRAGDVEDQMERLAELMYEYRMRSLIRCIETGRITALLTPSRPVYLVAPVGETPRKDRPSSKRPRTERAARSRSSPGAPARPDVDPGAPDRSGRQGQGQGPQGS